MKEIKNFKICHVSTNYNSKAGITRRTNLIVEALKKQRLFRDANLRPK